MMNSVDVSGPIQDHDRQLMFLYSTDLFDIQLTAQAEVGKGWKAGFVYQVTTPTRWPGDNVPAEPGSFGLRLYRYTDLIVLPPAKPSRRRG